MTVGSDSAGIADNLPAEESDTNTPLAGSKVRHFHVSQSNLGGPRKSRFSPPKNLAGPPGTRKTRFDSRSNKAVADSEQSDQWGGDPHNGLGNSNELAEAQQVLNHAYTRVAGAESPEEQRMERVKMERARLWVQELEQTEWNLARATELGASPTRPYSLLRIPNIGEVPPKKEQEVLKAHEPTSATGAASSDEAGATGARTSTRT